METITLLVPLLSDETKTYRRLFSPTSTSRKMGIDEVHLVPSLRCVLLCFHLSPIIKNKL